MNVSLTTELEKVSNVKSAVEQKVILCYYGYFLNL